MIDKKFLKSQTSNVQIKLMITFLFVREQNINRHQSVKYVIFFIFFIEKNANDKEVRTCFRRETHVVNSLKINILIENDIIESKSFVIDVETKIVYINICKSIFLSKFDRQKLSQFKNQFI